MLQQQFALTVATRCGAVSLALCLTVIFRRTTELPAAASIGWQGSIVGINLFHTIITIGRACLNKL